MVYRDSHNKALTDYPRPSVAVDTAVLTATPENQLGVVLARSNDDNGWRLPGTFLHEGEKLADAASRALAAKAGVSGIRPQQLRVFDEPQRDDRGWVLSVAHFAAVPFDRVNLSASTARVAVVGMTSETDSRSALGDLNYDHNDIIDLAVGELRGAYRFRPDPFELLPKQFTLRELHQLHEIVAGEPLMRDTFRRQMEPQLHDTGELYRGGLGKPARVFALAR